MIDFHNHVLPNVDDGPKTIEESIEMLKFASNQGITDVVNTVHFQHPKMDGKNPKTPSGEPEIGSGNISTSFEKK